MNKTVLAIVGLPGAGKTEVTEYIQQKTGWPKIHFGILKEHLDERGLELNEANERKLREEVRQQYGMGAFAIIYMPKIKEYFQTSGVILESLYSWEEYLEIKKEFGKDFKVLAVFASPEIRLSRLLQRPFRPLSGEEEFVSRENAQIENLHQAGPIARADFTVINEGSREELHKNLDEVLARLN